MPTTHNILPLSHYKQNDLEGWWPRDLGSPTASIRSHRISQSPKVPRLSRPISSTPDFGNQGCLQVIDKYLQGCIYILGGWVFPIFSMTARKSQRAPTACSSCAKRRVRCDKQIPCGTCLARGLETTCAREVVKVKGRVTRCVKQYGIYNPVLK